MPTGYFLGGAAEEAWKDLYIEPSPLGPRPLFFWHTILTFVC
jgi:hypothetical protein